MLDVANQVVIEIESVVSVALEVITAFELQMCKFQPIPTMFKSQACLSAFCRLDIDYPLTMYYSITQHQPILTIPYHTVGVLSIHHSSNYRKSEAVGR